MASNLFAATTGFSFRRGSNNWLRSDNQKSDTRAIPAADPSNRLEYMKTMVQTANVEGETIPLKRSDSVLVCRVQPAAGYASRFTGSVVCCLAQRMTTSRKFIRIDKS